MQVPCDEGVAIHIGPESCALVREGQGEALTGESTGQPLSRERVLSRVPTPCTRRKAIRQGALTRALRRPGVVRDPGMCRRPLNGNREISRLAGGIAAAVRIGKARSRSR